jgi:hypothetical protein
MIEVPIATLPNVPDAVTPSPIAIELELAVEVLPIATELWPDDTHLDPIAIE